MRPQAPDRLADTGTLDAFWRALPRDNVIAAQEAVCAVLVDPVPRTGINGDRLRALLLLDRYAQPLIDALLADLTSSARRPPLGPRSWQGAFDLCRLLGQALGRFLRAAGGGRGVKGWHEHLPFLLLRALERRRIELLLRPYVDERATRFSWKELHDLYRLAESCGLLGYEFPTRGRSSVAETTLEVEYIRVLLHDVLQHGNFPPHDAFWLDQNMLRWSRSLVMVAAEKRKADHRLVVDLDSDLALTRLEREAPANGLGLDPGPLLASIQDELDALRSGSERLEESGMRPARQQRVLVKVDSLFSPVRPIVNRRGEREPVALRVEVVVGVSQIARALRSKGDAPSGGANAPLPPAGGAFDAQAEGGTISGNTMSARTVDSRSVDGTTTRSKEASVVRSQLTMVDRSDSGCRLHGAASAETPLLPGVLFAFRMDPASPWTLAVVRRVKKRLAGKRVEIGAEYLGSNPRRVVVVIPDSANAPPRPAGVEPPRFAAIFLPESTQPPYVPMRTLVLPARGLAPEDLLTVRSHTDHCTIQLGEPLEEQAGFVWSPFEILDRWLREGVPEPRSASG